MADRIVTFTNGADAARLISEAEVAGERRKHLDYNDFALGINGGGTLTFETPVPTVPTPGQVRLDELRGKLSVRTMTLVEIIDYLALKENL